MIRNLVDFALNNRYVVLAIGLLLLGWGAVSFHNMPVEAYPDIADNYVNIISQWPGHSAEEMEQQVSVPVEIQMFGIPHLTTVRSESIFGLSLVTLIFDDQSVNEWNRQKVLERLTQVSVPAGVLPQIGTDWSMTGQIYWYTIRSTNPAYDLMNLRSIEDWTLYKEFRKVPNVVDVSDFGGTAREYQVRVDPNKLISYGLSISQVEQQFANNNVNAGGSFVEEGSQQLNVRALGLYRSVQDIENTVLTTSNGAPVRVKDIAVVDWGPRIRLGHMARADHRPDGVIVDEPDVIQGGVLMRKGAEEGPTLEGIHKKVDELNNHILPEGVKVIPMLDRSDLLHYTLHTVLHNLGEGMILVTIILLLFLGNVRAALIVAVTIPFSLLFASIFLNLSHIPANLISLGALDFGMVVDGAVVMVENIVRHLSRGFGPGGGNGAQQNGQSARQTLPRPVSTVIREACHEVQRPVFYAIAIIITAYMPIFTLQRVEGRLFRPMAWTVAFALLGAMTFSILIAPVLCAISFRNGVKGMAQSGYGFSYQTLPDQRALGCRTPRDCSYRRPGFVGRRSLPGVQRRHWLGVPAPFGRGRHLGARRDGQQRRRDGRHALRPAKPLYLRLVPRGHQGRLAIRGARRWNRHGRIRQHGIFHRLEAQGPMATHLSSE